MTKTKLHVEQRLMKKMRLRKIPCNLQVSNFTAQNQKTQTSHITIFAQKQIICTKPCTQLFV